MDNDVIQELINNMAPKYHYAVADTSEKALVWHVEIGDIVKFVENPPLFGWNKIWSED